MTRVAVIGVGQIPFKSRYPQYRYPELAFQAAEPGIGRRRYSEGRDR